MTRRSSRKQSGARSKWSNVADVKLSSVRFELTDQEIFEQMALYLVINRSVPDCFDDDLVSSELWRVWNEQGKDKCK